MKKVLLRGPILTQSGYGEHARFVYRSLKTRPDLFEVYVEPITWGKTSWLWEDNEERRAIDEDISKTMLYKSDSPTPFDIALLVTIPNEWQRIAPLTIGVTAGIESDKVSPEWLAKSNEVVDRVIVVSNFSKSIFLETIYKHTDDATNITTTLKLEKPIEAVNYPVKKYKKVKLDLNLEHDFNFLVVAQWGPRKNVENVIKWFVDEFRNEEVGLVLKMNKAKNCIIDRSMVYHGVKNYIQGLGPKKCKVYLVHGYMNDNEMHSLYSEKKIKALISLSHGEGYGLPMFEAAYCGLPIIAHDWGGQTDFLYTTNKNKKKALFTKVKYELMPIQDHAVWNGVLQKDSKWAYPDMHSAKQSIRKVYSNYDVYRGMANKLKTYVRKNFSDEKIYNDFIEAMALPDYKKLEEEVDGMFLDLQSQSKGSTTAIAT
jgi:glycosyltransferase involved in cell wall biosynthesis